MKLEAMGYGELLEYTHALQQMCDPAGDLRELMLTRDENRNLRAALTEAEALLEDCVCGAHFPEEIEHV